MESPKKSLNQAVSVYQLVVVDGNNVAYKYTRPPFTTFTTKAGVPTGVVYGLLKHLVMLYRSYAGPATQFVFCWDSRASGDLRKSLVSTYKSNRDHSGDGVLFEQMDRFALLVGFYGYQSLHSVEGYEADDVAYTVVQEALKAGYKRILLDSEDKDWRQMIGGCVHLYAPKSKQMVMTPLEFSFEVAHSFGGDAADSVRAVGGFTRDEVFTLSTRFKTVEEMVAFMETNAHLYRDRVLRHKEALLSNSRLVRLYHVSTIAERVQLVRQSMRQDEILEFFRQHEFSKPEQYLLGVR